MGSATNNDVSIDIDDYHQFKFDTEKPDRVKIISH